MTEQRYSVMMERIGTDEEDSYVEDAYPGQTWDRDTADRLVFRLNTSPDLPLRCQYSTIPAS
jgi:hypothetical protein